MSDMTLGRDSRHPVAMRIRYGCFSGNFGGIVECIRHAEYGDVPTRIDKGKVAIIAGNNDSARRHLRSIHWHQR